MIFQCSNVLEIAGQGVGPQVLTSIIFIIRVIFHLNFKIPVENVSHFEGIGWIIFSGIVILSTMCGGVFYENFLYVLQLLVYILTFKCFYLIKDLRGDFLYKSIRWITVFLMVVGVLQFLATTNILSIDGALEFLFYNDVGTSVQFGLYDYYDRIMSTFMEPSYYAVLAVGGFYYLLYFKEKWTENMWILVSLFVIILMTFSSTAYGAFAVVGLIFLALFKEVSIGAKVRIIVLAVIIVSILYIFCYDMLDSVIFSKLLTSSGVTRKIWNDFAIATFKESPIIGVGYKNIRGSGIYPSILAQIGVFGTLIFTLIMMKKLSPLLEYSSLKKDGRSKNLPKNVVPVAFALMSAFVCLTIAIPDLDSCGFWFWMYCTSLSYGTESRLS